MSCRYGPARADVGERDGGPIEGKQQERVPETVATRGGDRHGEKTGQRGVEKRRRGPSK
jgi:hypothetical protein